MSEKTWYVAVRGQQQGPMGLDEIENKIRRGEVGRDAHVFQSGMDGWVPVGSRPELADALASAPPPPPAGAPPRKRPRRAPPARAASTRSTTTSGATRCSS